VWHNVISMMSRYALGGITSHTIMLRAENLFQQARLLAGELSQRTQAYRGWSSNSRKASCRDSVSRWPLP
jgi:hypothetical protein